MPFKKIEVSKVIDQKRRDSSFNNAYLEVENEYELIRQVVEIRKELGVTQETLANKVGISQQEISRFENEKHIPKLSSFIRILDALGLEIKIQKKENHINQ